MSHSALAFPRKWTDVHIPVNGINKAGQDVVWKLLETWGTEDDDRRCAYYLPSDWRWEWKVGGKGEYVGTFPKRVSKLLHQRYGVKLTAQQLANLGSKVAPHVGKSDTFTLRFVDQFDWEAGDYGDAESCYWGSKSQARNMLADNGALAVQFQDEEEEGFARAWVVPMGGVRFDDTTHWRVKHHKSTADSVVIFNGYGLETLEIARILSHFWGLYYKRCALYNNECANGVLWINGGAGYLIAPPDCFDESTPRIDLEWEEPATCSHCNEVFPQEDMTCVGEDWVCESCLSEHYFYCDDCQEYRDCDEGNRVGEEFVCNACYRANYCTCDKCGKACSNGSIKRGPDSKRYCEECYAKVVKKCYSCGGECIEEDMCVGPDEESYCEACYANCFSDCCECGKTCLNKELIGELTQQGSAWVCEECYAKREETANA